MEDFFQILMEPWVIRALISSSMVGILCGVLGCFIVLRNMSLIGDALSHAILPGIFVAFLILGYSTIGFFIGSTIAGLITAIAITWIQQNVNTKNDAAIGIIFTAMFSIGVIGISSLSKTEGVHLDLKDFLFGNILAVSNEDIFLTFLVMVYTIVSITVFYRHLFITTFQATIAQTMGIPVKMMHYFLMLLLSFAVVASIRSVGVILVVAMLITPAATALLLYNRLKPVLYLSGFIGFISAISGFFVSLVFDTPPGPAMTLMATAYFFLAVVFAPEKGILSKYLKQQREQRRILKEDILKRVFKHSKSIVSTSEIVNLLSKSKSKVERLLNELQKSDLIRKDQEHIELTNEGIAKAEKLIRAHRLWETYQVDKMGLKSDQIHDEAERIEHLLNENQLSEIEQKLGYPINDPHGSPIPKRNAITLNKLKKGKKFRILRDQNSSDIESFLWEKDISFRDLIILNQSNKAAVSIQVKKRKISIPKEIANQIMVSQEEV